MTRLTREDAKKLGILGHWPKTPKPPSDGMNRLERTFWERLQQARDERTFLHAYREPFTLRLAGCTTYRPDFVAVMIAGQLPVPQIYEVKGFMRDDAAVKIKVAAETFPWLAFILVTREKRVWQCRNVTCRGISRETWTPEWLA